MTADNRSKINKLLGLQPSGVVLTSRWLVGKGYSPELLREYRKNQWLTSIGNGAMIRTNDQVDYLGAIFSLQQQLGLSVHPAAKTALLLQGKAHFIDFNQQQVYLFGHTKEILPAWFNNYNWGAKIAYY